MVSGERPPSCKPLQAGSRAECTHFQGNQLSCAYFVIAEWLFFMDEEIPYPIRTLLEWNPDDTSVFIQPHKKDWKQTAKKYGIEEENARNIFVNRRANFTLMQM